jgi:hypothetical protein
MNVREILKKAQAETVTLAFDSDHSARAFRMDCYRFRAAMRLGGVKEYDRLKFLSRGNNLIIRPVKKSYEIL